MKPPVCFVPFPFVRCGPGSTHNSFIGGVKSRTQMCLPVLTYTHPVHYEQCARPVSLAGYMPFLPDRGLVKMT